MGLPIWRSPEEQTESRKAPTAVDRTASARSSIRRRPSIHGRRGGRGPARDASRFLDRVQIEHSGPRRTEQSTSFSTRRYDSYGLPVVSHLLEANDSSSPSPPLPENDETLSRPNEERPAIRVYNEWDQVMDRYRRRRFGIPPRTGGNAEHQVEANESSSPSSPHSDTVLPESDEALSRPNEERPAIRVYNEWDQIMDRYRLRRFGIPASSRGRRDEQDTPERHESIAPGQTERATPRTGSRTRASDGPNTQARLNHGPRDTLPTPPHETSGEGDHEIVLTLPDNQLHTREISRSHPLSNSWRPDSSSVDGLGDRERSPTPTDGWEIMRSTITPDESLPSAHSSFASTAASRSFTSSNDTSIYDHSAPAGLIPQDDLLCFDDENQDEAAGDALAERVFHFELRTPAGFRRIQQLRDSVAQQSSRDEPAPFLDFVDIGYRLMAENIETELGRNRLSQLSQGASPADVERYIEAFQRRSRASRGDTTTAAARENPSLRPDANSTARANEQVHEYFRRYAADAITSSSLNSAAGSSNEDSDRQIPATSRQDASWPPMSGQNAPRDALPPPVLASITSRSERNAALGELRRLLQHVAQRGGDPDDLWPAIGLLLERATGRAEVDDTGSDAPRV